MLRSQYKHILRKCEISRAQRKALLCIVENCFPAVEAALLNELSSDEQLIDGFTDGINSVYKFLSGDLLAHDEFEDDHSISNMEYSALTLTDIPCASSLVNALLVVTNHVVRDIKTVFNQEQLRDFISAMHDLAKPKLHFLLNAENQVWITVILLAEPPGGFCCFMQLKTYQLTVKANRKLVWITKNANADHRHKSHFQ